MGVPRHRRSRWANLDRGIRRLPRTFVYCAVAKAYARALLAKTVFHDRHSDRQLLTDSDHQHQ